MTIAMYRLTAAVLVLAVPILVGCGSGGDGEPANAVGQVIPAGESTDGLTITFASEPDPLKAGDNELQVTVTGPRAPRDSRVRSRHGQVRGRDQRAEKRNQPVFRRELQSPDVLSRRRGNRRHF
jgi:hypothetical protein